MLESIRVVFKENWSNKQRLLRLANFELKAQNSATVLGFLWNFINPILQIGVYWFVFAIGLNTSAPKGEYPYIVWMVVGIIPWFFINSALMSTTMSFYKYNGIISHMYIPLSIIPVKTVISEFIEHSWAMLVVIILFLLNGHRLTFNSLYLIYYGFCSVAFLIGYSLITSAIAVLFLDFQKLLGSVIRLLFFITPVVWVQDGLPEKVRFILRLNPLGYLIEGYRGSILYGNSLLANWKYGIYFWIITIILFMIGCNIHCKFRKKFIDLL